MGKLFGWSRKGSAVLPGDERPWTVREAATFVRVSPQTVYLWVEQKKILHLRVTVGIKTDLNPRSSRPNSPLSTRCSTRRRSVSVGHVIARVGSIREF